MLGPHIVHSHTGPIRKARIFAAASTQASSISKRWERTAEICDTWDTAQLKLRHSSCGLTGRVSREQRRFAVTNRARADLMRFRRSWHLDTVETHP